MNDLDKTYGLLIQWLEDFKSKFSDNLEEIRPTVTKVEAAIALYKQKISSAMVKVNIQRARDARSKDGSVLEYGLDWHLERFVSKLKAGIPKETRDIDPYLDEQAKTYSLLVQWLEDFRSRFGLYEEAIPIINEAESALQLYRTTIGAAKVKVDIQKARDAKRAEGSILEYGLKYEVEQLTNAVTSVKNSLLILFS